MTAHVEIRQAEPSPAQLRAWAALWQRLLAPTPEPAPAPDVPGSEAGGRDDA